MPNVFHIANLRDSDRRTVRTGEAIGANVGKVIHAVSDTASAYVGVGGRKAMLISNANQLVSGKVFMAWKVSAQSDVVFASTVNADTGMDLGDRTVTIASGELITACGRGSIGTYDVAWLDASLDPDGSRRRPADRRPGTRREGGRVVRPRRHVRARAGRGGGREGLSGLRDRSAHRTDLTHGLAGAPSRG
jgi:hypothetical protein